MHQLYWGCKVISDVIATCSNHPNALYHLCGGEGCCSGATQEVWIFLLSGIGTQHVKRTFWNAVRNVLPERVDNYTTQRGQCFLQNVKRENVSCCSERGT